MLELPFKWIERERDFCDENWIEMRFLQDLLIAMEDREILGSAEIATNFSKLSCPAASQESPGMFYISVFHSDRFLQEVLLIIEDMESRGLDIIYYIKLSWILVELDHHHPHGDCYGIIAHCNGRQIFPGRAQLIATNFYMLSCSTADQESRMISLYSILWLIPARLAHYWRHGMSRTGYYISLVGSLMMSFIIMEIAGCIW